MKRKGSSTRYSADFKAQAVARLRAGEPLTALAEQLNVTGVSLRAWRNKAGPPPRAAARHGTVNGAHLPTAPFPALVRAVQDGNRPRVASGNDLNNLLRDILVHLREGEAEVLAMMHAGVIKKAGPGAPDAADGAV